MDTENQQPDETPGLATGVPDNRSTPLAQVNPASILDRLRPGRKNVPVAAFNSSL